MQPEQSVRTLPFALALAQAPAIPVQALEIKEPLAPMTMAPLRHPPHTVDAFYRTTGPPCVSQERIHRPIGLLPLRTQSLTQPVLAHHQLTSTNAGLTLRLLQLVVDLPQVR
jgi:hypothetical protein